jgi:hypothetical protein
VSALVTVAAETAAAAPAWNIGTVLGTAAVGALVALLVDFFLKPRLQVRNEKFSRKAKDLLDLQAGIRSMMIDAVQLNEPGMDDEKFRTLWEERRKKVRNRLQDKAEELQDVYGPAAHHLPDAMNTYIQQCIGLTIGACMSENSHSEIGGFLAPRLALAYDALYTPKTKFIGYAVHVGRVKAYLAAKSADETSEALRPR